MILKSGTPAFGKDHAQTSMIPKSGIRFSEKIMLKQDEQRIGATHE
jgi:hypothetical protein